jgi:hypothetical protein
VLVVGVQLCQANVRLESARSLRKERRHRLAGTAPGRPEIDDERQIVAGQMFVEGGGGQHQRRTLE